MRPLPNADIAAFAVALCVATAGGIVADACVQRGHASDRIVGRILWPGGSQDIVEPDLVAFARVVLGSQTSAARAGGGPAVAARLTVCRNRLALQARNGHRWRRASDSCAAYSTPTSATWAANGPRCGPGGSHVGLPMCAASRLARRARFSSLTARAIERQAPGLCRYVRAWARGEIAAPAGTERAVHTGGCVLRNGVSSCRAGRRPEAVFYGSNAYWSTAQSAAWSDEEIPRIVPP